MGKSQRDKGKRGEREAAKALCKIGIDARRGVQYSGGEGSPDVQSTLSNVHIEVKRTERFRLYQAMEQAAGDSGDKLPIVLHRSNGNRWVAVMFLDDLVAIARDIVDTVHGSDIDRLVGLVAVQTAEIKKLQAEKNI